MFGRREVASKDCNNQRDVDQSREGAVVAAKMVLAGLSNDAGTAGELGAKCPIYSGDVVEMEQGAPEAPSAGRPVTVQATPRINHLTAGVSLQTAPGRVGARPRKECAGDSDQNPHAGLRNQASLQERTLRLTQATEGTCQS